MVAHPNQNLFPAGTKNWHNATAQLEKRFLQPTRSVSSPFEASIISRALIERGGNLGIPWIHYFIWRKDLNMLYTEWVRTHLHFRIEVLFFGTIFKNSFYIVKKRVCSCSVGILAESVSILGMWFESQDKIFTFFSKKEKVYELRPRTRSFFRKKKGMN